jgi:hypothetical protein
MEVDPLHRRGKYRLGAHQLLPHSPPLRPHAGVHKNQARFHAVGNGSREESLVNLSGRSRDPALAQCGQIVPDGHAAGVQMAPAKNRRMGDIRNGQFLSRLKSKFGSQVAEGFFVAG